VEVLQNTLPYWNVFCFFTKTHVTKKKKKYHEQDDHVLGV
jgi:hypothetical protein